jgi:DNA repair exonuclease SbcCD nuclease subunit
MEKYRFIHAADIHLDSPLCGLQRYEGAPVDEIRNASRRALENMVNLAIDERVAFVVIAGDLYDGDWKDHHTGLFFVAQMHKLRSEGIPVVLIRGNHDAANKMTSQLSLPDNVTMLDHRRPQTVIFDDLGVAIHGQSFARQAVDEDLSQGYPFATPGLLNVGILHTCATGSEVHKAYAPCTIEGLCSKGYDYWALGHIHKPETLCADPYIIFPGNLQGRHIRETGAKGCVMVDVENGRIMRTMPRPLDVFRWQHCWVDASGAKDTADLLDSIRRKLQPLLVDAGDRSLAVRIELAGACPAHRELAARPEQWIAEVRGLGIELGQQVWIEKVKTATTLPVDLNDALAVDGPLGELARFIDELRGDPEQIARLLGDDLADLRKKLPVELLGPRAVGESATNESWSNGSAGNSPSLPGGTGPHELLDQVQQMLVENLSAAGRNGALA